MNSDAGLFLAVMFVDICGSTRLFAEYGDEVALTLTTECINDLKVIVRENGGTVVQTQGDGILCTFPSVDNAFLAAATMYDTRMHRKLSVHGGFHYGPVIPRAGNVFGDAVNMTSRLVDLAKDDELLMTEDAMAHLSQQHHAKIRPLGKIAVKGKTEPMKIFLVVTVEEDATQRCELDIAGIVPTRSYLELKYGEYRAMLRDPSPDFVMGRQEGCDLVVNHSYASRRHATVEVRRGKYYLVDHSTNGTWVIDHHSQKIDHFHRDVIQLSGSGYISLGSEPKQNEDMLLYFREAEELA